MNHPKSDCLISCSDVESEKDSPASPQPGPSGVAPSQVVITAQCCGPGSGIRCLFDPWIRDGQKNQDPDPGWTSRIIFPRAKKQFIGLKILNFFFFDADPDTGSFLPWIRNPEWKKLESGINIPDPQHCHSVQLLWLVSRFRYNVTIFWISLWWRTSHIIG